MTEWGRLPYSSNTPTPNKTEKEWKATRIVGQNVHHLSAVSDIAACEWGLSCGHGVFEPKRAQALGGESVGLCHRVWQDEISDQIRYPEVDPEVQ